MDYATAEYGQIYEQGQRGGYEAPAPGDPAHYGGGGSAQHLNGGSVRDPRLAYRQEEQRDPARAALGRGVNVGGGGQKNRKGLLGLSNLGNTCFMNAALQCLTHTHGLQKYFRFCSHAYTSKGQSHRQKLLMSFAHWFERDWGKNVSAHYHSPEDILRCVQQLNPIFQGYAQQDSQEFLRCVLDNIHEELRREVPDDLRAHLLEVFGLEAGPGGNERGSSSSDSGAAGSSAGRFGGLGEGGAEPSGSASRSRPSSATAATSATRQFMQLCQTTEAATDVGEIRLPTAKSTSMQQTAASSSTAGPSAGGVPPVFSPAWAEESSSAASSSSGFPPSSPSAAGAPSVASSAAVGSVDGSTSPARGSGDGAGGKRSGDGEGEKADREKSMHYASIISELFQGHVVSTVRCLECQRTSRTKEPVYDVSVQIPNPNELAGGQGPMGEMPPSAAGRGPTWTGMLGNVTGKVKSWFYDKGVEISDCLRKFCAPEYLVGKDKYDCEFCKRKTDGERRFAFKDLPEVLCIHVKRFRYDASWFNATKNSRVVTFPVSKPLDMSSFLEDPPAQPVEYRLIGVIQHIGSMGGGHYISYCQHKRKPQEWYEFDDLQVSLVSPEQVERAEPYVLFYQRMPSKGNKLDRQTFKNDHRRMQENIRRYLVSHPAVPAASSSSGARAPSGGEEVAEEVRNHGPAVRNLYRNPPAELDMVFVSKHWYVRLTTMSHPGPLDNYEYLCPHGLLGCYSAEMAAEPFLPISRVMFQSLVQKYGGGPVINALEICPKCQRHIRAYNDRKQAEYDLVSKYDTKCTGDGKGWYLVDAVWVNKWKRYVRGEHVSDIADMSAPGPVSNTRLFDKNDALRNNLRLRIDYIGVNARVWWLFMHVHGGGPAICREDLDIYSAGHPLETELKLEELKFVGPTADFARRTSHGYVDDCKGDMELHEQRYSLGRENTEMADASEDSAQPAVGFATAASAEAQNLEP